MAQRKLDQLNEEIMFRIPANRPPTHPGEMLLEAQFWLNLQLAWDLYRVVHSPAEKEIRKIRRLPALARAVND